MIEFPPFEADASRRFRDVLVRYTTDDDDVGVGWLSLPDREESSSLAAPTRWTRRRDIHTQAREAHDGLLRSGYLPGYLRVVLSMARRSKREHLEIPWVEITAGLRPVATFLQYATRIDRRFMLDVASAHLSLARENLSRPYPAYLDYCASADLKYGFDGDVRRATRLGYFNRETLSENLDAARMPPLMVELLASYRRHLSYSAGLVRIRQGGCFELKRLATRPIPHLERILTRREDRSWDKVVLGDEYSHIHRAITGSKARFSREWGEFHFWDTYHSRGNPWKGTYTLQEFAALVCRADVWERGWMLGRTMELTEVETAGAVRSQQ